MTLRMDYYVLDDNNTLMPATMLESARFFARLGQQRRRVGYDMVGGCLVSTIFLGLDHRFSDHGPPLVFETMVFVGGDGGAVLVERYSTWSDALIGHRAKVRELEGLATKADALLDKVCNG